MVVLLENYRGFQIRRHEKITQVSEEFDYGVVCVHCPEGVDRTYVSLSMTVSPYLLPRRWPEPRCYIRSSHIGPCEEDSNMVVAINYLVSRSEDKSFSDWLIAQITECYKNAIDTLWK